MAVAAATEAAPHKFVGGALCLDFVNTVGGRVASGRTRGGHDYADRVVRDHLGSYADLVRWAELAGAVAAGAAAELRGGAEAGGAEAGGADGADGADAADTADVADVADVAERAEAASVFARAVALREALYRLFKAAVEGWEPELPDLAVLNRELARARRHERLVPVGEGFRWEWEAGAALDRVLWPVVRSAAELLTSPELRRVGQCGGEECGWLYLDVSRGGRRRWCDMADCGNLAKVRRYRERRG